MSTISVIIPVYGVEKYIERFARSLFGQTFKDLEYVFVNDCTKDNSIAILEDVAKEYPSLSERIKIINLDSNQGVVKARSIGLQSATGEYIICLDSDDYIEPDMIELLHDAVISQGADCALCDYYLEFGDKSVIQRDIHSESGQELVKALLLNKMPGFIWRGLYSRELISNITIWPVYSFAEDIVMNIQMWLSANKIVRVSKPLYHYCTREGTLSRATNIDTIKYQVEASKWVVDFADNYLGAGSQYDPMYKKQLVYFHRSLVVSRFTPQQKYCDKELRKLCASASKVRMFDFLTISNEDVNIKEKLIFVLDEFNILPIFFKIKGLKSRFR